VAAAAVLSAGPQRHGDPNWADVEKPESPLPPTQMQAHVSSHHELDKLLIGQEVADTASNAMHMTSAACARPRAQLR
jgi:hypothetical protein